MKPLKNTLRKLLGPARYYQWLTISKVRAGILWNGILSPQEFKRFSDEINNSEFLKELLSKRRKFHEIKQKLKRNHLFAGMDLEGARNLYAVIRKYQPDVVIETGVNHGFSTSFILQAMELNQKGKLYSIDLPSNHFQDRAFWDSIESSSGTPGWVIPKALKERWNLQLGDSRILLPQLLQDLGSVDIFIHDGLHTYENMTFEFQESYEYIEENGLIISDDINWNNSLFDFAQKIDRKVVELGGGVGVIAT